MQGVPHLFGTLPFAVVTARGPQAGPRVDTHAAATAPSAHSGPPESATARAMVPWVPKDANLTRGDRAVLELVLAAHEHMCSQSLLRAHTEVAWGPVGWCLCLRDRPTACGA